MSEELKQSYDLLSLPEIRFLIKEKDQRIAVLEDSGKILLNELHKLFLNPFYVMDSRAINEARSSFAAHQNAEQKGDAS